LTLLADLFLLFGNLVVVTASTIQSFAPLLKDFAPFLNKIPAETPDKLSFWNFECQTAEPRLITGKIAFVLMQALLL